MSANINDALKVLTPDAQWSLTNVNEYSTLVWYSEDIPEPSEDLINQEIASLNANQPLVDCKNEASKLLYETDWTTIPDITNTANDPYLTNQADFIAYRNAVRKLAVNPVADPVFPPVPTAQWSA
jgi:hypothetical protein